MRHSKVWWILAMALCLSACLEDIPICKEGEKAQCLEDKRDYYICIGGQLQRKQCPEGSFCEAGRCVGDCENGFLDKGEEGVDCGGHCKAACLPCERDADCGLGGFCDVALGKRCTKRCYEEADCRRLGEAGEYRCRADGRCSPVVIETVWDIPHDRLTLKVPIEKFSADPCQIAIDWGDGQGWKEEACALPSHRYLKPGSYHVKLKAEGLHWTTNNAFSGKHCGLFVPGMEEPEGQIRHFGGVRCLAEIVSFGNLRLTFGAFSHVGNVKMPKRDIPDASSWETGARMFSEAKEFNQPIGHWDTSRLYDMSEMFAGARQFNQPLENWDTSKVYTMRAMFQEAKDFNQPLGRWNTSNVSDMGHMFEKASAFNQPLENWNTESLTNMSHMFAGATQFNQPLKRWKTASVQSMAWTFASASAFDQDISSWDTSSVRDMSSMFHAASQFNQPLQAWNTRQVINMSWMFALTKRFNQPLASWDLSSVQNMSWMFSKAERFQQDLSPWKLSLGVNLLYIFKDAALSKALYCKLMQPESVWLKQRESLGLSFTCP